MGKNRWVGTTLRYCCAFFLSIKVFIKSTIWCDLVMQGCIMTCQELMSQFWKHWKGALLSNKSFLWEVHSGKYSQAWGGWSWTDSWWKCLWLGSHEELYHGSHWRGMSGKENIDNFLSLQLPDWQREWEFVFPAQGKSKTFEWFWLILPVNTNISHQQKCSTAIFQNMTGGKYTTKCNFLKCKKQ